MKGPGFIPSLDLLALAYAELQSQKKLIAVDRLLEITEWTRFDPRLLEQLVEYLKQNWRALNPMELNFSAKVREWPATLGVALEQVKIISENSENRTLLRAWMACALADLPRGDGGLFFIGVAPLGGKISRREASAPSLPYTKWGYLWGELAVSRKPGEGKSMASSCHRALPLKSRESAARALLSRQGKFRIGEYLQECKGLIGRRQAERDLKKFRFLVARGATRAREYVAK
jgi:hypothetical protein